MSFVLGRFFQFPICPSAPSHGLPPSPSPSHQVEYLQSENATLKQECDRLRVELTQAHPYKDQLERADAERTAAERAHREALVDIENRLQEALRTSADKIATLEQELRSQLTFSKQEAMQYQRQARAPCRAPRISLPISHRSRLSLLTRVSFLPCGGGDGSGVGGTM